MNFYQQKYFKPYHKIVADHHPPRRSQHPDSFSPPRYDSNSRSPSPPTQQPAYGEFRRSPFKHIHAQQVAEPIWQHLYNAGKRSQKELLERHNHSKNRIDIECTFQPIIKTNKRYLAASSSTFLERVNIWQENKLEKMIREKEEGINKDLKECTFAPQIKEIPQKSRNQNVEINHNKSQTKMTTKYRNINPYYSPIKTAKEKNRPDTSPAKKKKPKIELDFAKSIIRTELKRIAF